MSIKVSSVVRHCLVKIAVRDDALSFHHVRASWDHGHDICHRVVMEAHMHVARVVKVSRRNDDRGRSNVLRLIEHIIVAAVI